LFNIVAQTCVSVSSRNPSYTAPELYSKHNKPIGSEKTLEKVYIYI